MAQWDRYPALTIARYIMDWTETQKRPILKFMEAARRRLQNNLNDQFELLIVKVPDVQPLIPKSWMIVGQMELCYISVYHQFTAEELAFYSITKRLRIAQTPQSLCCKPTKRANIAGYSGSGPLYICWRAIKLGRFKKWHCWEKTPAWWCFCPMPDTKHATTEDHVKP